MKKYLIFIDKKEKTKFIILIFLMVLNMLFEAVSIGMIFPIVSGMTSNTNFENIFIIKHFQNNNIFASNPENVVILLILILLLAVILKNIFLIYYFKFEGKLIYNLQEKLSLKVFSSVINKDFSFHINSKSSDFITKIRTEVSAVSLVILSLSIVLSELIVLIGITTVLMLADPLIFTQVFLATLIFSLSYYLIFYGKIKKTGTLRRNYEFSRQNFLTEGFNGIREIKIFNLDFKFLNNYKELGKKLIDVYSKFHFYQKTPRIFLELTVVFVILITVLLKLNHFDLSSILYQLPLISLYLAAIYRLLPSFSRIMVAFNTFRFSKINLESVYNEISYSNNYSINKDQITKDKFNSIVFKNVSFHYLKNKIDTEIVEDLNMTISKGDKILIKGKTGSGKSTILNLLMGLLEPTKGKILLNNKKLDLKKIITNKTIGYVPQNTHLFDETLKYNITLEDNLNEQKLKKLKKIISICYLEDFLSEHNSNFSLDVGEGGQKLSGGQRQRVGIARALFIDPDIIILDEATNSLDKVTETKVLSNILKEYSEKTLIFVSHNEAVKSQISFNKIISLEKNKILIN